ncbi:MAG: geranylgeranyl reductase family protein [Spirochaetota bacterium]
MISRFDVIVIGGGPSGSTAARVAADKGARVLLVEEGGFEKKGVQCSGLISLRTFNESGAGEGCILREIRGAFMHTPDGRWISIDGGGVKAVVIDRVRFDEELLKKAQASGVEVKFGWKAVGIDGNRIRLRKNGEERDEEAKVFIGADGPQSRVAKWVGLPGPRKILSTLQAILPYRPRREDFVEVYLGRDVAPNFFAWAVPASSGFARVGLASDVGEALRSLLGRLIEKRFSSGGEQKVSEIVEIGGGMLPIGLPERTVSDHVLLVGDAAGQVKPTSGGGIYTGMVCARIAGEVAAQCAMGGDTSAKALREYERRWRSLLEKELFFGFQVHNLLCQLRDEHINRIFRLFDSPAVMELFTRYGDIDYPSVLAKQLLKNPGLWGKLLRAIPAKGLLIGMLKLLGI